MENKNHKVIMLQLFAIVLAIVGVTIAISYLMEAINFKSTGVNLAVDYTGTLTLPTTRLYPIEDSEVDTNTENVMRVNFSVKGASTNNTSKPIIYDVILSNLDMSNDSLVSV